MPIGYAGDRTLGFASPAADSTEGLIDLSETLGLHRPNRYPVRVVGGCFDCPRHPARRYPDGGHRRAAAIRVYGRGPLAGPDHHMRGHPPARQLVASFRQRAGCSVARAGTGAGCRGLGRGIHACPHAGLDMPAFGLIDANSFYCSCQWVFEARIRSALVVVLSNNDGCAIARTKVDL